MTIIFMWDYSLLTWNMNILQAINCWALINAMPVVYYVITVLYYIKFALCKNCGDECKICKDIHISYN